MPQITCSGRFCEQSLRPAGQVSGDSRAGAVALTHLVCSMLPVHLGCVGNKGSCCQQGADKHA